MPKFGCECGNILNLSGVWPECEARLVPMACIGEIADKLDVGGSLSGDAVYDLVDGASVVVYRCDVCGRGHLKSENGTFDSYVKEMPI